TVKTSDSKLTELHDAQQLQDAVHALARPADGSFSEEDAKFAERISSAKEKLAAYEYRLQDTLDRRRDPDGGQQERARVEKLHPAFDRLAMALRQAKRPTIIDDADNHRLIDDANVAAAVQELNRLADDLVRALFSDLYHQITIAKTQYHRSLVVVITTSVTGVLLMAGLLRFFFCWIFHPIRDLQDGVRRVAAGNFDGKIELKSGDELEELASAFNEMTDRLNDKYTDLAKQVNERGKQLIRSERLASVGFLAAGVAHEINNPLASVAFCAEALERRLVELLSQSPREQETITKY